MAILIKISYYNNLQANMGVATLGILIMLCCRFGSSLRCRRGYLLVNGGSLLVIRFIQNQFVTIISALTGR
jgi:hypothetical protein